jgi:hypothetical protein
LWAQGVEIGKAINIVETAMKDAGELWLPPSENSENPDIAEDQPSCWKKVLLSRQWLFPGVYRVPHVQKPLFQQRNISIIWLCVVTTLRKHRKQSNIPSGMWVNPRTVVHLGVDLSKKETREPGTLSNIVLCVVSPNKMDASERVLFVLSKDVSKHKCQLPNWVWFLFKSQFLV